MLHQRSGSDTHLRTRSADEPREAVTVTCVQGPVGVELSVGIALAAHERELKNMSALAVQLHRHEEGEKKGRV